MVPFGGWLMPVQYTSILEEHQTVRNKVGVFDISHMGEITANGPRAGEWLNTLLTNNISRLEVGSGQYTLLLNETAGIIDDLIVYRIALEEFLLVVNASRIDDDFDWLRSHLASGVQLQNRSEEYAALAIQGPRTVDLFQALFGTERQPPAHNQIAQFDLGDVKLWVARTGYTGEDGVEIFLPAERAARVWKDVLATGGPLGIRACGLGSRDTLRLEMCYPLNGSDLSTERNPIEAGLGFFVDLDKPNFTGREELLRIKKDGPRRRLIPFRMKGKGPPPRPHYAVWHDGEAIGEVTSGTLSPSLNYGIGMAYVSTQHAKSGNELEIEIRSQKFIATIEKKPLYKKS